MAFLGNLAQLLYYKVVLSISDIFGPFVVAESMTKTGLKRVSHSIVFQKWTKFSKTFYTSL